LVLGREVQIHGALPDSGPRRNLAHQDLVVVALGEHGRRGREDPLSLVVTHRVEPAGPNRPGRSSPPPPPHGNGGASVWDPGLEGRDDVREGAYLATGDPLPVTPRGERRLGEDLVGHRGRLAIRDPVADEDSVPPPGPGLAHGLRLVVASV